MERLPTAGTVIGGSVTAGLGGRPDRDLSAACDPERKGSVGDCDRTTSTMLRACIVVPLACRLAKRMTAFVKMLWGGGEGYDTFGAIQRLPTERPMSRPFDASRSLAALEQCAGSAGAMGSDVFRAQSGSPARGAPCREQPQARASGVRRC